MGGRGKGVGGKQKLAGGLEGSGREKEWKRQDRNEKEVEQKS